MEYYKFQLSFKGDLVENSVDAFDVANTILAMSQSIQEIAEIRMGEEVSKNVRLNINAFKKGSLITDFLFIVDSAKDLAPGMIPIVGQVCKIGKDVLDSYKTYLDIKKFLKGNPPKKVTPISNKNIEITAFDGSTVNVNYFDYRALQSKTLAKSTAKVALALTKEDSQLQSLSLLSEKDEDYSVDKQEARYFEYTDELQEVPSVRYKGMVTKIDTKTCSGYLSIGSKRIPFNYDGKSLAIDQFDLLIESLHKMVQIYLVGSVQMDLESNPKSMFIRDVQMEQSLF